MFTQELTKSCIGGNIGGNTGGNTGGSTASQIMFWTNTSNYGSINVYMNNVYRGTIASYYSNALSCGANGCMCNSNRYRAK